MPARCAGPLLAALLLAAPAAAESLASGGIERHYRLHLPPGGGAPALVVALHGIGDDIAHFAAETGFDGVADRNGFAVLYPEGAGSGHGWNAGFCCGSAIRDGIDDVAFVLALVAATEGVDHRRVFLAGISNGGMLAYRIAAEHPERIAGVAVVAGAIGGTGRDGAPRYAIPAPALPVPAMIVHGMQDPYVLYAGGVSSMLRIPGRRNASVAEALALWARANRCRDDGTPVPASPGLSVTRPEGCAAQTVLWSYAEGGHEWFSRLGEDSLAEAIWRFFAAQKPR
jgi:polyhydroxybutyrate depolymerase